MKVQQTYWSDQGGWHPGPPGGANTDAHLVLVFGSRKLLSSGPALAEVRRAYPAAVITGCSTAGEICGDRVLDDTVVVTALTFATAQCVMASVALSESRSSAEAGRMLAARLPDQDRLRHVIVFSDGLNVNGSELVQGLTRGLPSPKFQEYCIGVSEVLRSQAACLPMVRTFRIRSLSQAARHVDVSLSQSGSTASPWRSATRRSVAGTCLALCA